MLNNIKNGCKRILTLNIRGGQSNYDTPESRMQNMVLTSTFANQLDKHGTLESSAHKERTAGRLRLARGVLLAIGIALCSASPAGQAMPAPKLTPAKYASLLVGDVEASCLWHIALKESNIRYNAVNRSSGAVGAWQFMNPKLKDKTPLEQVELAVKYSIHRYGTPCEAWEFWKRNYWW